MHCQAPGMSSVVFASNAFPFLEYLTQHIAMRHLICWCLLFRTLHRKWNDSCFDELTWMFGHFLVSIHFLCNVVKTGSALQQYIICSEQSQFSEQLHHLFWGAEGSNLWSWFYIQSRNWWPFIQVRTDEVLTQGIWNEEVVRFHHNFVGGQRNSQVVVHWPAPQQNLVEQRGCQIKRNIYGIFLGKIHKKQ